MCVVVVVVGFRSNLNEVCGSESNSCSMKRTGNRELLRGVIKLFLRWHSAESQLY